MTFFHRPVGLVELLILYARVQFYTPRASDYRLISKTVPWRRHVTFGRDDEDDIHFLLHQYA